MHVDRTKGWTAFVAATLLTGSCVAPRTAESGALESLSGDAESMVMLRLEASVDGKTRNPLDPLSGFKLLLAPLDGVDTPPRVQKLLSPTRQSRNEGWIHFTLPPGDYFLLAVPPGRDQNPPAVVYHLDSARYGILTNTSLTPRKAFWNRDLQEFVVGGKRPPDFEPVGGFWFQVPGTGQAIYAGTLSAECTGLRGIFGNLVGHCAPIKVLDERDRAAALVATLPGSQSALSISVLTAYGDLSHQAQQLRQSPLEMHVSSVTDVGPGVAEARKRPSVMFSGMGDVLALVVLAAEEFDRAADRAAAARTNQALAPCMDRLAQRMDEMNVSAMLQTALADALGVRGDAENQAVATEPVLAGPAVESPQGRILTARVSAVKVRECVQRGTHCLEVGLLARLAEPGTNTSLYAASLRYTSLDVSADPGARYVGMGSLPVESTVACHPVEDYCGEDEGTAIFEAELRQALTTLAAALALRLTGGGA